jgi:hypothetical protein
MGPLFSMFSTLLCASLKFFVVLFSQVNGIARFGGFEFVGLALVGKRYSVLIYYRV